MSNNHETRGEKVREWRPAGKEGSSEKKTIGTTDSEIFIDAQCRKLK